MSQKLTIDEMRKIAAEKKGKCLSEIYVNSKTKLQWECAEGHHWETAPSNIKQGSWCPICSSKRKGATQRLTIEEMKKIAFERGGKCLSKNYINGSTKLQWECALGHQWVAEPNSIKQGRWCPQCGIERRSNVRKLTIEEMQNLAENRGGRCLSKIYVNSQTNLLWECAEGHQWEAEPSGIKQGRWCPRCGGTALLTIDDMCQLAEERGGKCLSCEYINNRTKLLWECFYRHQWKAPPDKIKQGRWCPECSSGLGERICRAFFEQLFDEKFPKSYPRWLINDRCNQMELDGYCEKLQLAFEHQGEQHFSLVKPFIKTKEDLLQRQKDDQLKIEMCKKRGILLIQISEIPSRLSIDDVKSFIRNQCLNNSFSLPDDFSLVTVNLKEAYQSNLASEMMEALMHLAKARGGRCLSEDYINDNTKLLWKCEEGHQWETSPNTIKNGKWCPICIGMYQTIDDMKKLAISKEGKCLSNEFLGTKSKLLWECSKGHQWEAIPNSIKTGKWCPTCGIKRSSQKKSQTIADMHKLANDKLGKCLSERYVNSNTKLKWECAKGHQWEAIPSNVKHSSWCPVCSENIKMTVEDMQKLAGKKGGVCLSKTYINSSTKLLWMCSDGHHWEASPSNIKSGYWCPNCSKTAKLTIEEMQTIAKAKGGRCLSNSYTNCKTKLLWECAVGHQWEAIPNNIKKGSWCPVCAGKKPDFLQN